MSSRPKVPEFDPAKESWNLCIKPESRLILVSANDNDALSHRIRSCVALVQGNPGDLPDIAYSLIHGRKAFRHRAALVLPAPDELAELSENDNALQVVKGKSDGTAPTATFMFPGQGSQHLGMGRQLYEQQPAFRQWFEECDSILARILDVRLSDLLYESSSQGSDLRRNRLMQTSIAQPALFTIEYALGRLLMSYGVKPESLLGHSIGEFAAATLAGVFELEAALELVAARGQLMQSMPAGSMMAVTADLDRIMEYCVDGLDVAALNAPGTVVVSGTTERIDKFAELAASQSLDTRLLHTSHAFHSVMMDPILEKFAKVVESASPKAPDLPIVSTMTGTWLTDEEASSSEYWAKQLRNTVRFADAVSTVCSAGNTVLVEVGPGVALTASAAAQQSGRGQPAKVIDTLGHPKADQPALDSVLRSVGKLWIHGVNPDFDALYEGPHRRLVRLPTYPFTRARHWIDPPARGNALAQANPVLGAQPLSASNGAPQVGETSNSHESSVLGALQTLLESRLGVELEPADLEKGFLQLGFDSLGLSQLAGKVNQKFGIKVAVRRLFQELPSPAELAEHLVDEGAKIPSQNSRLIDTGIVSESATGPGASPQPGAAVAQENSVGTQASQSLLARMTSLESALNRLDATVTKSFSGDTSAIETQSDAKDSDVNALTQGQREIWVAARVGGDIANLAYNECRAFAFAGEIDLAALLDALAELPRRHQALRHTFAADGESFIPTATVDVPIDRHDVRDLDDDSAREFLERLQRDQVSTPFDLVHGPLLRGDFVRTRDDASMLILCAHHIVVDGSSWELLIRELAEIYSSNVEHRKAELPVADSFDSYSASERGYVSTPGFADDENYWLDQLRGYSGAMSLPEDSPRPAHRTLQSARRDQTLSQTLMGQVRARAAELSCTPQTLLFGAFQILLHRLSRQDDFVVGIPTSGQAATGFESLVGNCVNVLPIRTRVDEKATAADHIKSLHEQMLDSLEHQRISYTSFLPKLDLARDASRPPLIQVSFGMGRSQKRPGFAGLDTRLEVVPRVAETFELYVYLTEDAGGMQASWSYNSTLFSAETIEQWQRCFECVVERILEAPEAYAISAIPILNERDRKAIIALGVGPDASMQPHVPVHQKIWQRSSAGAEAVALIQGETTLSFNELNARANRVAHWLLTQNIAPNSLVAVCLDRTPELVSVLLGIWRAGLGYVPLDPAYPSERLKTILEDAGASLVIVSSAMRDRVPKPFEAVCIDAMDIDSYAPTLPPLDVDPRSTAYVIFTSGSTGRPKGVQISQSALANFIESMSQAPGFQDQDSLLAITTISFDISLLELFLPLYSGGSVVLASRDEAGNPRALQNLMEQHEVSVMQATPATWQMLFDGGWQGSRELKVLCGGESFPRHLAERFLQSCGEVWNVYGPTETTVWSTIKRISSAEELTIGRPINNTSVYVLDAHTQPVPLGVSGELWIGGAGVAQGYLGRPELTAERFVDVPGIDAGVLYRTGDLARQRADGDLECLGRADFQVKIRGFRIELGEIETALVADPRVATAVVVAREDSPGDKRLVAYIVGEHGTVIVTAELRDQLVKTLPGYMVPSAICVLDSLPMTPNNKVDRKSLPPPDEVSGTAAGSNSTYSSKEQHAGVNPALAGRPPSDIEAKVAEVFARHLRCSHVNPQEDFFELGGHSLLAIRVMNDLNEAFSAEFSVASIFENSTVEALAKVIESEDVTLGGNTIQLFNSGPEATPFFLICGIALYRPLATNLSGEFSSYGIYVEAEERFFSQRDDQNSVSLEELASEYAEAIAEHPACSGGRCMLGGVSFGGLLAFEVARQLHGKLDVEGLVLLDTLLPHAKTRSLGKLMAHRLQQIRERGLSEMFGEALKLVKEMSSRQTHAAKSLVVEDNNARLWRTLNSRPTVEYLAHHPTYSGRSIVVRASQAERPGFDIAADLGWSQMLTGDVTVVDAPGDHLGLIDKVETAEHIMAFRAKGS